MGRSGAVSLQSLIRLKPYRICCLVNGTGKQWLKENIEERDFKHICIHTISPQIVKTTINGIILTEHQVFGSETFVRLTPLKWTLINEVMAEHADIDSILFSDLDIVWRRFELPDFELNHDVQIYAQNDESRSSAAVHYCTGIMYWRSSSENMGILKNLFDYQMSLISSGKLVPDEPAFNRFFETPARKKMVKYLGKDTYVIGHRSIEILLSRQNRNRDLCAFHANYVVGDYKKWVVLKSIESKLDGSLFWIAGLILVFFWKFFQRIKTDLNLGKQ